MKLAKILFDNVPLRDQQGFSTIINVLHFNDIVFIINSNENYFYVLCKFGSGFVFQENTKVLSK